MDFLTGYFRRMGIRRFLFVLLGNLLLGMGVGLFRLTNMGCDPFNAMNIEVSKFFPLDYGTFQMLLNLVLFAIEFLFGRKLIGCGTLINACLLGYINTFFFDLFSAMFGTDFSIAVRLVVCVGAVIVCSFGLSLYQTPNSGVAPYDSIAIILHNYFPRVSYFWWRMLADVTCAATCFVCGGLATGNLGIGTVICAFCLGPVIQFFNRVFTEKVVTAM